jgi:hypothetical protein
MEIHVRRADVGGAFDLATGQLISIPKWKYASVDLCFRGDMHVPFATIKLYDSNLYCDARATFDDAVALGAEIARRWNAAAEKEVHDAANG